MCCDGCCDVVVIICVSRGREWYTLVFVNRKAEQESCHNEEIPLADVRFGSVHMNVP